MYWHLSRVTVGPVSLCTILLDQLRQMCGFRFLAVVSFSLDGRKVGVRGALHLLQVRPQWNQAGSFTD